MFCVLKGRSGVLGEQTLWCNGLCFQPWHEWLRYTHGSKSSTKMMFSQPSNVWFTFFYGFTTSNTQIVKLWFALVPITHTLKVKKSRHNFDQNLFPILNVWWSLNINKQKFYRKSVAHNLGQLDCLSGKCVGKETNFRLTTARHCIKLDIHYKDLVIMVWSVSH